MEKDDDFKKVANTPEHKFDHHHGDVDKDLQNY